jgi:hypothetical protein
MDSSSSSLSNAFITEVDVKSKTNHPNFKNLVIQHQKLQEIVGSTFSNEILSFSSRSSPFLYCYFS